MKGSVRATQRICTHFLQGPQKSIAGELSSVHFNIHVSFPFFASSKPQLNLHLHQVTISLKTVAYQLKIFIAANRVYPLRILAGMLHQDGMTGEVV